MNNVNLLITLAGGSLLALSLFFIFYRLLAWKATQSGLVSMAVMLLLYVPLGILNWAGLDMFAIHFAFFIMIPFLLGFIFSSKKSVKDTKQKGLHWGPKVLIGFFVVLTLVDGSIIYMATKGVDGDLASFLFPKTLDQQEEGAPSSYTTSHFSGTIFHNYHDKENQYDEFRKNLKMQLLRGWSVSGGWKSPAIMNEPAVFSILFKDKSGKAIERAKGKIDIFRSSSHDDDVSYELKENSSGEYSAKISLTKAGCWQVRIIFDVGGLINETNGNIEVAERIDGKIVPRPCLDD